MFERRKDIFDIRVRGPQGAIRNVWTEVVHCTPYALHGDAVPMFKGNKVSMWSVVVFFWEEAPASM